jgi:Lon protease-like protein
MLRRCLESPNPFFGMIMPPKAGCPPVDYGTILDIRSVQMLPDGRSMVETWGSTRFRILERGFLDGYMVGRIERQISHPMLLTNLSHILFIGFTTIVMTLQKHLYY